MDVFKHTAALALALGLLGAPSALAAPAGSEYLPQVPKTSHDHSGGDSSASGGSTGSTGYSSDYTPTQASVADKPDKAPRQRRHPHHAKRVTFSPKASVEPDTGGSGAIIPLALALMGAVILGGGLLTRRRHKWQLNYQAEERRREALGG